MEINVPTTIPAHDVKDLVAAMWVGSEDSLKDYNVPPRIWSILGIKHELDLMRRIYHPGLSDGTLSLEIEPTENLNVGTTWNIATKLHSRLLSIVFERNSGARGMKMDYERLNRWNMVRPGSMTSREQDNKLAQKQKMNRSTIPDVDYDRDKRYYYHRWDCDLIAKKYPDGFVASSSRLSNRPRLNLDKRASFFGISGLVYGGLHCLAWNAQFINGTHRILWQISCVIVMSSGIILVLMNWIRGGLDRMAKHNGKGLRHGLRKVISASLLVLLWTVLFPAYLFARGYLVIECFISLFQSPMGIYSVPQWSSYLPHIG